MEINTNAFAKNALFTSLSSGDVFKLRSSLYMKIHHYEISGGGAINAIRLEDGIGDHFDEFEHVIPYPNAILTTEETKIHEDDN